MTDDSFHSQTPLLFDQVGVVESVMVAVGLGSWEVCERDATGFVLHPLWLWQPADIWDEWHSSPRDTKNERRTREEQQPRLPSRYPGRGHVTQLVFFGSRLFSGSRCIRLLVASLDTWTDGTITRKKKIAGNLPPCVYLGAARTCSNAEDEFTSRDEQSSLLISRGQFEDTILPERKFTATST